MAKRPTAQLGDTVHYFANSRDQEARADGAPFEPRLAVVEAVADSGLTLRVHPLATPDPARFSDDPERFAVRYHVPHRSTAKADDSGTGESQSFWDFVPAGA